MTAPPRLSAWSDPLSLGKLQVLLVPVQSGGTSLSEATYQYWSSLIRRHATLRADELRKPSSSSAGSSRGDAPRLRFFPGGSSGSNVRISQDPHIHVTFPSHPPPRHLYPFSLLRLTEFPLVVIGISASEVDESGRPNGDTRGYNVPGGDLGEASTPTAPTFNSATAPRTHLEPTAAFEDALRSLFPDSSPFPLVKRLVMVPSRPPRDGANGSMSAKGTWEKSGSLNKGKEKRGEGDVRWALAERAEEWVGGLMGEMIGDVIGELGDLATALETPQGLKTLANTMLPSLTSTLPHPSLRELFPGRDSSTPTELPPRSFSATPSHNPHSNSLDHLNSAGLGISLTRALTPGGRPTSIQAPSLPPIQTNAISSASAPSPPVPAASSNPFRRSTAITSPFTRTPSAASNSSTSSLPPIPATGKYTTANISGVAGGRLMKILGDFYLLVGSYVDAIKCYDDGAERCRVVGDVLWEAGAREGRAAAGIGEAWEGRDGSDRGQTFSNSPIPVEILAHYLSASACLSRSPLPYPPTILSPSPQSVSGSLNIPAPTSTHAVSVGTGEGLLADLYTSLSLRITHFLLLIWASGGWGSVALSHLMSNTFPKSYAAPLSPPDDRNPETRRKRTRTMTLLCAKSGLTRNAIWAHTEGALGPHHRAMTKTEQLALHVEAIWLARWLDLPRREAAIIREVVKRIGVMVVEGREETRRLANAGFAPSQNGPDSADAVGLGLGMAVSAPRDPNVAVRRKESTEGNSTLIELFARACHIMGIDILTFHKSGHRHSPSGESSNEIRPPRFGWPELQVEMMKEGIAVAEALPDHPSITRLCVSALRHLHPHLNPTSQGHLSKMYPAALSVVRRRGLNVGTVGWWIPGRMVLSLEIAALATNRLPVEHSSTEILAAQPGKKRDPFLYNPRLKAAEAGRTVLVTNEQVDVFVTLQNPFAFDLEISNLDLLTEGTSFTTAALPLVLPANSVQTVRASGIASAPGNLQIKGVKLRLADGSTTDVLLPVADDTSKRALDARRSRRLAEMARIKRYGVEARYPQDGIEEKRQSEVVEDKWLECKVVPEQPLLWVKKTNLNHGTVMLYNGESSTIRLVLENSSSVPVDFVKLSFDDSTIREAQAIIAEGELTPEQAYELDWDVSRRPVFAWDQTEVSIPPGGRTTLSVRCLGKVGCTDGSIRVDYGYVNRPETGVKSFHTRQITFPVVFTVYHTLEVLDPDIIHLVGSSSAATESKTMLLPNGGGPESNGLLGRPPHSMPPATPRKGVFAVAEDELKRRMEDESDEQHCLVSIGVRNAYGVPFEISLARHTKDNAPLTASRLVPPGATERLLIPLPRLSLPPSTLQAPIPTLSDRQYVVDKLKKTPAEIGREREMWWFRDALLSSLSVSWVEPGSHREGSLSLRDQGLTREMLDVLKMDLVELRLLVTPRDGSGTAEGRVRKMEFVKVKVEVHNRMGTPLRARLSLDPDPNLSSGASPRRRTASNAAHVLIDGVLVSPLPEIPPGGTQAWSVGAMFLASGKFAFRAVLEETGEGSGQGAVRFSPVCHVIVE